MDINLGTHCPYCRDPLSIRDLGNIVVLGCKTCQIEAVLGDDRFLTTKDVLQAELDGKLKKRAERVAEGAKEVKGRYTEVK